MTQETVTKFSQQVVNKWIEDVYSIIQLFHGFLTVCLCTMCISTMLGQLTLGL